LLPLEPGPGPCWRLKHFLAEVEPAVHDVLNVVMCTGFPRDRGQYFMRASPVRPGDLLEFFAEIDLPGGPTFVQRLPAWRVQSYRFCSPIR